MVPIEFRKPNILISNGGQMRIESAGDLSTLTDDEEAYLAELILRGVVVRDGPWFKIEVKDQWSGKETQQSISRSRIIALAREEGL